MENDVHLKVTPIEDDRFMFILRCGPNITNWPSFWSLELFGERGANYVQGQGTQQHGLTNKTTLESKLDF